MAPVSNSCERETALSSSWAMADLAGAAMRGDEMPMLLMPEATEAEQLETMMIMMERDEVMMMALLKLRTEVK